MVAVVGLDRLDGTRIASMSDQLWSQHSAEITRRFGQQQPAEGTEHLGFDAFCKTFESGTNTTQAMLEHDESTLLAGVEPPIAASAPAPAACFQSAAAARAAATPNRFPLHWGQPPMRQTKDLRPFPGGYGQGSGTVAKWIVQKMAEDAANPSGGGGGGAAIIPTPAPNTPSGPPGPAAAIATLSNEDRPTLLQNRMRKASPPAEQQLLHPPANVGRKCGGARGIGPAWTRGEIEPPTEDKNMGTWMAKVYSAEQQRRLGINESGKPVAPVALDTICPNSMDGTHCYQSRANVFKCTQCGAKQG
jgi:hypothetical protein